MVGKLERSAKHDNVDAETPALKQEKRKNRKEEKARRKSGNKMQMKTKNLDHRSTAS